MHITYSTPNRHPRPPIRFRIVAAAALAVAVVTLAAEVGASSCTRELANTDTATVAACSSAPTGRSPARPPAPLDNETNPYEPQFLEDNHRFPPDWAKIIASVGVIDEDHVGYFWSASRGDGIFYGVYSPWTYIDRAILHFTVVDNLLEPGEVVRWELLINEIPVGLYTVNAGQTGPFSLNVSFPQIVGRWRESGGFGFDVAFRVVNEVHESRGAVALATGRNSRGDPASLELIGPSSFQCMEFEHYYDAISFIVSDYNSLASWENIDGRGAEVMLLRLVEDGLQVFTCTSRDCPEGQDWEFRVDLDHRTFDLKNLTTGITHRKGWPLTVTDGVCPM